MDRKDLDVTLYLVTDSSYHTEESLLRTVEEACKGGVTLVQLREKNKGGREYLDKAFKVKEITDRYNVPLIIDDRVDVALACDAAGVHVGSSAFPAAACQKSHKSHPADSPENFPARGKFFQPAHRQYPSGGGTGYREAGFCYGW